MQQQHNNANWLSKYAPAQKDGTNTYDLSYTNFKDTLPFALTPRGSSMGLHARRAGDINILLCTVSDPVKSIIH